MTASGNRPNGPARLPEILASDANTMSHVIRQETLILLALETDQGEGVFVLSSPVAQQLVRLLQDILADLQP